MDRQIEEMSVFVFNWAVAGVIISIIILFVSVVANSYQQYGFNHSIDAQQFITRDLELRNVLCPANKAKQVDFHGETDLFYKAIYLSLRMNDVSEEKIDGVAMKAKNCEDYFKLLDPMAIEKANDLINNSKNSNGRMTDLQAFLIISLAITQIIGALIALRLVRLTLKKRSKRLK